MDIRAFIVGVLAALSIVGAILLAALNRDIAVVSGLLGLSGTFGGYVVGLYSEVYDPPGRELVDEPAGVTRAGDAS